MQAFSLILWPTYFLSFAGRMTADVSLEVPGKRWWGKPSRGLFPLYLSPLSHHFPPSSSTGGAKRAGNNWWLIKVPLSADCLLGAPKVQPSLELAAAPGLSLWPTMCSMRAATVFLPVILCLAYDWYREGAQWMLPRVMCWGSASGFSVLFQKSRTTVGRVVTPKHILWARLLICILWFSQQP